MSAQNKMLTVITSELLTFRMSAVTWSPAPPLVTADAGLPARGVIVYKLAPGSSDEIVAQFADVHAIYWDDEVTLVTAEDH